MPPIPVPNPSWVGLILLSITARFRKPNATKRSSNQDNGCMPTYSVLIPAYNEEDLIGRALESCAMHTVKPQRVVLLEVNGFLDNRKIVGAVYPQVEIIRSNQRQSKALNIAQKPNPI